jgi:hypothetical protein
MESRRGFRGRLSRVVIVMAQTCSKCSRANPADAVYCYYDGFVLAGHSRNGGPVAVGAQSFASPFVFPTGRTCRNFNELALACVEEWDSARELLKQGYLETFLGGLGRIDLVMAAKEAAKFPDHDRGLDQFLNKLPSETLSEPRLEVETRDLNLGIVPAGTERQFQIHLENQGMRLLYGTVSCSEKTAWLTLGEGPGVTSKSIQFGHDLRLTVKVVPDRLRAGNKPLEGSLVVETNGGVATIKVRAEVPIKPFPAGVLGGAKSPRQVAEKAKLKPKEAADLFETGAVAEWYKDNGWTYPVQGPASSGVAAVQQFFEALGLTAAPRVQISERQIALKGKAGSSLRHVIKVETPDKKPVFAHGTSNQPWLEVGRAKLAGRSATINLSVPAVPNRPGETLTAQLVVQSNGNQRFVVPVTLRVSGQRNGAPMSEFDDIPMVQAMPVEAFTPVVAAPPMPTTITPAAPLDFGMPTPTATIVPPRRVSSSASPMALLLHAVPALLLAFCLLLVLCWDVIPLLGETKKPDSPTFTGPAKDKDDGKHEKPILDTDPLLGVQFKSNQRFGLVMLKEKDPKNPDQKKKLTRDEDGGTNNTIINVDGYGDLYGIAPGKLLKKTAQLKDKLVWESSWEHKDVRVVQHVEVVRGEQSQKLDTCLVWYRVENNATVERKVGVRIMLDTYIGANDGVPFVIPGQKELLTDMHDFGEKEIPDYIEALEKPDLSDPGTVAHLGLKGNSLVVPKNDPKAKEGATELVEPEPIVRMLICYWPGSETRWELEPERIRSIEGDRDKGEPPDSCVFLYWPYREMAPKEVRYMAFTYGLGKMAATQPSGGVDKTQLALTTGGAFRPGREFTVTSYVKGALEGQKITLELPSGLSLMPGEEAEKAVGPADKKAGYSQVSWKVKAGDTGEYDVRVKSGGATVKDKVKITIGGVL